MSYELRLRKLKESWNQIQILRDERKKQKKIQLEAQKHVRRLSQLIPKMLDDYNKTMP